MDTSSQPKSNPTPVLDLQVARALKQVGAQMRAYRKRVLGLTGAEMAERLGVSRPTYLRLEAGEPTVAMGVWAKAWALAGVLNAMTVAVDPIDEVFIATVNDLPGCGPVSAPVEDDEDE